jgi:hypothetical protein
MVVVGVAVVPVVVVQDRRMSLRSVMIVSAGSTTTSAVRSSVAIG